MPLTTRPRLVVFDVNETLSDLAPVGAAFEELGLSPLQATAWFAGILRDGFALTVVGELPAFAGLAADQLRALLPDDADADAAVELVLSRFTSLDVHPDVVPGVEALAAQDLRMVTLSNGAASVAEALLERAGIRDRFERLMSVEEAGVWKPSAGAYGHALETCGVAADEAVLVAVHPWDVDGAQRAGLAGAWLDRTRTPFPRSFLAPDLVAPSLPDLAAQLAG